MKTPNKLGKYEVRRELGRGAMGVVYEAFDPLIERTVAIKTILKSSIDEFEAEEVFARFRREARAAGRLSHPGIVSIYEYGEDDEMAFIVMEILRGKELKEHFDREKRFTLREGLDIVMQLLSALEYSHERGVVHRDIKPANIMITDDGLVKVADFGIAKIDSTNLTLAGVVLGTPTYMSPEQFMGKDVDHRTDIYATGVILYQFLSGKRPFTGSVITIMHQAANQEAIPPSKLNPNVTQSLDEVVKRAMAKRAEDRYQSAAEFIANLKIAAKTIIESPPPEADPDATMIETLDAFAADETLVLPNSAKIAGARREAEIESWRRIKNSQNPADFLGYIQEFPSGEFVESANLLLAALEQASRQKKLAEEQNRLKQEAEAKAKAMAEAKAQAEAIARAEAIAKAEAEAKRKRDAEKKVLLAQKIEEVKSEVKKISAEEKIRRQQEAEQRAKELAAFMSEHARKFAEAVAAREAAASSGGSVKAVTEGVVPKKSST